MASAYDEDLKDNAFYQTLQKDYSDIFYNVIMEGCVICVPRAGSLPSYTITLDDILGHIIIPNDEMPESHFQTLNGKSIKIFNRLITMEYDTECLLSINILFEETYYTDDLLKYKVLCIEHPLEPRAEGHNDSILDLKTLRDCLSFLTSESGSKTLWKDFERLIHDMEASDSMEDASLQTLKDLIYNLYNQCLQVGLNDRSLREKARVNQHMKKNIKLAIETYVNHKVYKEVFKWISASLATENAKLNKVIKNSHDVQLRDLEVRAELHDLIPKARTELGKLEGYSTVLGKLTCLKKVMAVISKDPESGGMLATDDILPIFVFLILKTNITNWYSHLSYLKNFNFSADSDNMGDEDEFLVTTLEAAVEHVKSGDVVVPVLNLTESSPLNDLFRTIAENDLNGMKRILEKSANFPSFEHLQLCHPLCRCETCSALVSKNTPSLESSDESGITALHVAAMYGQPAIIDEILSQNIDPNETDFRGYTALHHAALRGHQHVLLLLLQMGAEANTPDNSMNTPLHFACLNGHVGCVKALIYHCEHEGFRLLVNSQNTSGNTALHHASKYGYLPIVEVLIDNNADPGILNRQKLSPFHVANNSKVSNILSKSRSKLKPSNVKPENFDFMEESPDMRTVSGEVPDSPETAKRVEKMLKAVACGDINLVRFYLGIENNLCHPLCSCAKCNKPGKVQHVRINMCNAEGLTALHLSASNGCFELTQFLLSHGANSDVQTRSKLSTPLILACQNQRIKVARTLLEFGCKIDMHDSKANTALHYACLSNNRRLVEILLQYGPKLSQRNKSGRTALQEAEAKMALGIADMLRAYTLKNV